MMFSLVLKGLL